MWEGINNQRKFCPLLKYSHIDNAEWNEILRNSVKKHLNYKNVSYGFGYLFIYLFISSSEPAILLLHITEG